MTMDLRHIASVKLLWSFNLFLWHNFCYLCGSLSIEVSNEHPLCSDGPGYVRDVITAGEDFTTLFKGKLYYPATVHYFVVMAELHLVYILNYCF